MEHWDATAGVDLIARERCTHMAGATPFLVQLLAAAQQAGTRLPELKVFICGGASVSPSLIRTAASYFERAAVTRVYGSTEVPVTTVGALHDVALAADTDGGPGIADVRLGGHVAAPTGVGEIRVRGAQMLVGYLHPEDEHDAFDDDGYFRTGDLGSWHRDCLVVTGRAKDIIIRNGENISPRRSRTSWRSTPASPRWPSSDCSTHAPANEPVQSWFATRVLAWPSYANSWSTAVWPDSRSRSR